jgi:hypothetical protein
LPQQYNGSFRLPVLSLQRVLPLFSPDKERKDLFVGGSPDDFATNECQQIEYYSPRATQEPFASL